MNISEVLSSDKGVSTKAIFKTENASVMAMQILEGELLKEHMTKIPALLTCVVGEVVFENEKGAHITLGPGDYLEIEPMVKHWVKGRKTSQLLLVK